MAQFQFDEIGHADQRLVETAAAFQMRRSGQVTDRLVEIRTQGQFHYIFQIT